MDQTRKPAQRRRRFIIAGAILLALAIAAFALMWRPAIAPQPAAPSFDAALITQGARLATLGNCAACHTVDPARPFAGGLGMTTPFGTVHSTNITPDARTGIGAWSEAAFTRALRQGVARDGSHLYPAFPYDHYTRLSAADVHALYAYFMTRTPLDAAARPNQLRFPFNFRPLVAFWNILYLDRTPRRPDPAQSAQWNRGAYLADALAHCSACHSPRTKLGGEDRRRFLDGGEAEGWYAPALNDKSPSPLPWTRAELAAYLRHGIVDGHAVAGGPMQEVVQSLAHAEPADVEALAAWLHTYLARAPARVGRAARPGSLPMPSVNAAARLRLGHAIYANTCARCHEAGRSPGSGDALPLQQAIALYDPDPRSLVRIVRDGIHPPEGAAGRWMPGYAGILDDEQTIALAAYLRQVGAGQPAWDGLDASVRKGKRP
jgi:mono/diheme cytochrome c family protein